MKQLKIIKYLISFLISVTFLVACKKDKIQTIIEEPISLYATMVGHYKVYDTLDNYLYDMDINHSKVEDGGLMRDSLHFINFDGEFSFNVIQPFFINENQPNYIRVGYNDTLWDSFGKRWKILSDWYASEYSKSENDTFYIKFRKTNINYYLQDLVPYYECECSHVAVKQP